VLENVQNGETPFCYPYYGRGGAAAIKMHRAQGMEETPSRTL
jgi:hypothetical protein